MAIHLELAASIHAMRASVWRSDSTSAEVRQIQPIGRWSLIGLLVASSLVLANVWFLDTHDTPLLLAQSTARAMDHVWLGIRNHVNAEDFAVPHTRERLADLEARMNSVLAGLTANDSGAVKEDLIAADGTIIYSGTSGMAGLHEPPAEQWMLDEALAGRVTTMLEEAPYDPGATAAAAADDRIFDVYVPVRLDGVVVGAYELDVRLPPTRLNQPTAITLLGSNLAAGLYLLRRFAAKCRRRLDAAARPPTPPSASALHVPWPNPNVEALGHLTRRELDVLRSLARGDTYRMIATELVLSEETIRTHVKRILRKTGHPNRTALLTAALRAGIIDLPGREPEAPARELQPRTSGTPIHPVIELIRPRGGPLQTRIHPRGGPR